MNMMQMVGVAALIFFVTLTMIVSLRDKINIKLGNAIFTLTNIVIFFLWNYSAYMRGGLDDGFMTLENISPLIFTVIPLVYFVSDKLKGYAYSAIAFLSFGMFVAMIFSPSHTYLFSYNLEADTWFTCETFLHMNCALFGIYLVLTDQVKADFEHWIKSIVFMLSIISFGVFLNYTFHKSFFGMDPYGNFSIYMIDIFGSFEATLAAYYLGIFLVLTLGMQLNKLMYELASRKTPRERAKLTKIRPISTYPSGDEKNEKDANR